MKAKKHTELWNWQHQAKLGEAKCAVCGISENLTVDHILPVSFLEPLYLDIGKDRYDMIYNDSKNFQYLCAYHNKAKGNRLDIRNPKTIPLLKKLIEQLEHYKKLI